MTPKEKAIELVEKFAIITDDYHRPSKQCALIAVENFVYFIESHNNEWFGWNKDLQYWQEVKQEINKL